MNKVTRYVLTGCLVLLAAMLVTSFAAHSASALVQDPAQASADSAAALNPPDFVPSTHPVAFVWATVVAFLGSLLSEGFQLVSSKIKGLGAWPKRFVVAGTTYGLALLFRWRGIDLPTDPASLAGAGSFIIAGSLMSFGAHELLFAKTKKVPS